jgi:hypothetical protein
MLLLLLLAVWGLQELLEGSPAPMCFQLRCCQQLLEVVQLFCCCCCLALQHLRCMLQG